MELSIAKCESIVDTLPIGFYAGRRINIKVDRNEETSFYDPMNDEIVISYPIIAHRCKVMPEGSCDEEEAVRSMLYHEVSHAILTPASELNNSFQLNCMEDERIETVLRHYYHGVDFRKQLMDVHGGKIPEATDSKSAYFNAVRFGLGTARVQKKVNQILKDYAKLNRSSRRWGTEPSAHDYEYDINELWRMIQKEFQAHPEEFQPKPQNGNSNNPQEMDTVKDTNNESKENGTPSNSIIQEELHECELSSEEVKHMVGACLGGHPDLDEAQVQKLAEFQKTVEMIIGNFNKKNRGGSGINAYSGVFNPRAVARKDYRYFERAITTQGNNKFGTCHLNLIIDCSGSFSDNVPLTNGILAVLSEIERKNRNFSLDVGFINHEFHLCKNVRERKMVAEGGNDIPDNMKEILMQLQKPQTCNYNIILFDGDALCNRWSSHNPEKLFGVFDMKQTTLITDPDNESYMEKSPFTSSKVVVTENYTEELIDHIIHALMIAFG